MSSEIQKWCNDHWQELRRQISDRGMDALVSRGGEAAAKQFARDVQVGTAGDDRGFDPLLRAWSMLNKRALELGMGLFQGCPPCWVQKHQDECKQPGCEKPTASEWMARCADSLLMYAKSRGLVRDA